MRDWGRCYPVWGLRNDLLGSKVLRLFGSVSQAAIIATMAFYAIYL